MPRRADIGSAFRAAVQYNTKGYQFLHTSDFVRELRERGWHFSEREANEWIERYQDNFIDKTTTTSDNRYWILRNMGMIF